MKVLHYIPSMARNLGGVATYVSLLSGELGQLCELVIVTSVQDNDLPMNNCKVVNLDGFTFTDAGLGLSWKGIKAFVTCCNKILDDECPDIVHINGIWSLDRWIMQRQALKRGIKTYIMPHGMLEPWILHRHYWTKKMPALLLYERKALKSARCLIATAESERQNMLKLQMNKAEIPVVSNGVDVNSIPMKTDWNLRRKILYVSRIHPKKGVEMLIDVVSCMTDHLKDYEVVIAGEGESDYVDSLKEKVAANNLNIHFVGGVYGADKWHAFQDADFLVLPTYSENFGYVIAESLACGTPVITTHGTPWNEIDGVCGYWIERTDEALRDAMGKMLYKSTKELECMGRKGRKLIENNYSAKAMAEQLLKVYE